AAAIERVGGLPVLQPLDRDRRGGIAVVLGERQCTRRMGVNAVARQRVAGVLQLLGEGERYRRVLVEDNAAASVVLDEGGAELAYRGGGQALGLCRLQQCRNQRQLALVGFAHRLHHAEILDEGRRRKVDLSAFGVPSARARRVHHVAVESMHARIRAGGNG